MERVWWKEAIGYELYPKSFMDTNGDGIGDLKGIIKRLPYLKELGIDLLWICPFFLSPMRDNGYDVEDYYAVDPQFGNMADMDALLEKADALGIRVIIDMVLNHTSDRHRWFQEALKDPKSKYRDFYIFKESKDRPSNARSCFGGSVWEKVEEDVWYYHTFDKTQPDLNWECKELRQEIYRILNYWLDKGVSGFRLDAITYIKKGASLENAEPQGDDGLHDVADVGLNQPGIGEFLLEMRKECIDGRDAMTVAEAPGVPYEEIGEFIGKDGYFSMIFDFSYVDIDLAPGGNWYNQADWTFPELKKLILKSQLSVQKQGWGAIYLENHDQSRSLNKYFRDRAAGPDEPRKRFLQSTALGTLLFGLRGTVFLYQGEELGVTNTPFDSVDEFDDLNTIDQYYRAVKAGFNEKEALKFAGDRSRDNSRTPYPWNAEKYGGFSDVQPWIKLNPGYREINARHQLDAKDSIFRFYQKLIRIRREEPEILIYGLTEDIDVQQDNVLAFSRKDGAGKKVSIYINMGEEEEKFSVLMGKYLSTNYDKVLCRDNILTLRPYEAVMLKTVQNEK